MPKYNLDSFEQIEKTEQTKYLDSLPPVTTTHVNLLLVDKTVSEYQLFVDSSNDSTYPIVYCPNYDSQLLLEFITKSFSNIERVAVVSYGQESIGKFLNREPFDSYSNIQFVKELANKFGFKTIDFLACDVLKYSPWVNYFNELNQFGLTVGASNDKTGNIKYGGDWVLESSGYNIKSVYWTNLIDNYSELLDTVTQLGITYSLGESTASVVGFTSDIDPDATIPLTITENSNTYNVTSIGEYAFADCTSLTSVDITNSVNSIGPYAFFGCTSLTSVTIGNSVTSIGTDAFLGCTSLTNFDGGSANIFVHNNIALYRLVNNTYELCQYAIGNNTTNYSIPDLINDKSITSIGPYAFADCISLTSVTIPTSVITIGTGAFIGCTSLTSVTIGNSVTSIEEGAFAFCISLTSVTIPNSVTSIDLGAFFACTYLTSVTIGNSVNYIGSDAFADCISLTSVTIGNSVNYIGSGAFKDCIKLTHIYIKTENLQNITISKNSFYNMNKTARFYLPYEPTTSTFLGYPIRKLNNYTLNVSKPTNSSLGALSDYHYLFTNQYMQLTHTTYLNSNKKITKYIEPTPPYKNPFNLFTSNQTFNLVNKKLTYIPDDNKTKYNITKTELVPIDTSGWTQNIWSNEDDSSINIILGSKSFNFYGIQYNNLFVGTNGLISFQTANNNNNDIVRSHLGNKQISIFYKNLVVNTSSNIITEDYFGFYYSGHSIFDSTTTVTYEAIVKLYFSTGQIEVNYIKINPNFNCLIGLSDGSGANYDPDAADPNPVEYSVVDFGKL